MYCTVTVIDCAVVVFKWAVILTECLLMAFEIIYCLSLVFVIEWVAMMAECIVIFEHLVVMMECLSIGTECVVIV